MHVDEDVLKALQACGFKPPEQYCVKVDPRGGEYGEFRASDYPADDHGGPVRVEVVKVSLSKGELWRCVFRRVEDFVAWADECT
jgi:hypothetical protein